MLHVGCAERIPEGHAVSALSARSIGEADAPGSDAFVDATEMPALHALIDEVARTSSVPRAGWRTASAAQLRRSAELTRAAVSDAARRRWEVDIDAVPRSGSSATAAQRGAIGVLAAASAGNLRVTWNEWDGTPREIRGLAYVHRGSDPRASWESFRRDFATSLDAVFDIRSADDLRVNAVDTLPMFHVVRVARYRDGVRVETNYLNAYVTREDSIVGPGIVDHVVASWRRGVDAIMPSEARSAWVTAAAARTAVGAGASRPADLFLRCGARCRPVWSVVASHQRTVEIDAIDGSVVSDRDPRGSINRLTIGGWRPGDGAPSVFGYRFADARTDPNDSVGVSYGWTDPSGGTHTMSGAGPVWIGHVGPRPTGTWPSGRVDRRDPTNEQVVLPSYVAWYPDSQANRFFSLSGSTGPWPPDVFTTAHPHASAIAYGWLTHLQSTWFYDVGVEVPQTLTYRLLHSAAEGGIVGVHGSAGGTPLSPGGPPGSGQMTWGGVDIVVGPADDIEQSGDVTRHALDSLWTVSHEHGHAMENCAATSGPGCGYTHPAYLSATEPYRLPYADWRLDVWDTHLEDLPEFFATAMTEYRVPYAPWFPNWVYDHHTSQTDDFSSPMQDNGRTPETWPDCRLAGVGCPANYSCVAPTGDGFVSPRSPTAGLCLRLCSTSGTSGCTRALPCEIPPDVTYTPALGANQGVCWWNNYENYFFANVGARLSMDAGWNWGLFTMENADADSSGDPRWDLVGGSLSWYANMALVNPFHSYEISRAVRSVYVGSAYNAVDDFTDDPRAAVPIPRVGADPTNIWWGNGAGLWPHFNGWYDSDIVMFRGVGGSSYVINGWGMDQGVEVQAVVYRWVNSGGSDEFPNYPLIAYSIPGASTSVSTSPLPADDWYFVLFWNANWASAGNYRATIALESGSDDASNSPDDAYPAVSGVALSGGLSGPSDADHFSIRGVGSTYGSTLAVSVTPSSLHLRVYAPYDVLIGEGDGSVTGLPVNSFNYRWEVSGATSATAYTTTGTVSCSPGPCDYSPPDVIAGSWGGRRGGFLATGFDSRSYQIDLDQRTDLTFAVTDYDPACRPTVEVRMPPVMAAFGDQPLWYLSDAQDPSNPERTLEGAATNDTFGTRPGIGGHVQALHAGRYEFVVGSSDQTRGCSAFRIFLARSNLRGRPMPEW